MKKILSGIFAILAFTLFAPQKAEAQFIGPYPAYILAVGDTLSDSTLVLVWDVELNKARKMYKVDFANWMNNSGGDASFDSLHARTGTFGTLSCATCYFSDTLNNIRDTVNTMLQDGVAIINVTDFLRVLGPGGIGSAFRADTGSAGITIGADVTVQNDANIIGADTVHSENLTANNILKGDTTYTRALLIGEKVRGLNSANFGPTKGAGNFSFGGPVAGGYTGVIVNPTNTGYTALGFSQDSSQSGGTAPVYLLRYNSNYATSALRGIFEIGGKSGIHLVTGNSLNKTVSIDTTGRINADSLTVTGHSVLENVDITDLTIGSTHFTAFETNLAGDTITQSCGGPGQCAIRIGGAEHEPDFDYATRFNAGITATATKTGGFTPGFIKFTHSDSTLTLTDTMNTVSVELPNDSSATVFFPAPVDAIGREYTVMLGYNSGTSSGVNLSVPGGSSNPYILKGAGDPEAITGLPQTIGASVITGATFVSNGDVWQVKSTVSYTAP